MKNFLFVFVLIFSLYSCSSLSKNSTAQGSFTIKGGVFGDDEWQDELSFQRVSWFKELTLYFDIIMAKVEEKSPFYRWFSEDEKEELGKCQDYFIATTYASHPKEISLAMFKEQMRHYGYFTLAISHFKQNLNMHPDYSRFNLDLYNTELYCHRSESPLKGDIFIQFPGHKRRKLFSFLP